jgi:dTDP-4-dehydrorhamnose reductase
VHASDRAQLDLADATAVARVVADLQPGLIVNCAADNDVDGCEDHPVSALAVNALGVRALARAAREAGSTFVHYSSDFVFDGETSRPYVEDDPPSPRSVYASSKLLGEWFAADVPRHYVLRVESLFGPSPPGSRTRRGSLGTIVDRIRGGEVVPVFIDRTVSPSFTPDVASATRRLVETNASPGLYHCVNQGMATWIEIAEEIARRSGVELQARPLTLETVTMKARRPRFCALSPARLAAAGIAMPSWQDALARYLTL